MALSNAHGDPVRQRRVQWPPGPDTPAAITVLEGGGVTYIPFGDCASPVTPQGRSFSGLSSAMPGPGRTVRSFAALPMAFGLGFGVSWWLCWLHAASLQALSLGGRDGLASPKVPVQVLKETMSNPDE
jgi:hypothetical protein